MSDPYIVEIWGQPARIVFKEGSAYRFHAVATDFFELEGTEYDTPGKARLAAAKLRKLAAKRISDRR